MTESGVATPECPPVCWETADSPVGDGSRSRLGTASPWQPQAPPHLIGGQVRALISMAASATVTAMAQVVRVFAAALAALAAALAAGCSGSSGSAAGSPWPSVAAGAARTTHGQQSQ